MALLGRDLELALERRQPRVHQVDVLQEYPAARLAEAVDRLVGADVLARARDLFLATFRGMPAANAEG